MSIDYKEINDWEVLTPSGWQSFSGIKRAQKKKYVFIEFVSGKTIECSVGHKLKRVDGEFVDTTRLRRGTKILGENNSIEIVSNKKIISEKIDLYDLIEVDNGHEYLTNGVVSSNCAFIDGIEEIWLSAQNTLSTGGNSIILSTPSGVGNFFHKTWIDAEAGSNEFNTISLPWHLHPERDQKWRDLQTKNLGEKGASQECDCTFSTSGNTVIDIPVLEWYTKNQVEEPKEKRGFDRGYWIYRHPVVGKSYMVSADVARGDANDYSAAQILDIETLEQVAEYKGKIPTKEYAHILMTMATEYNQALLVVENAIVGWAVLQELIDCNYQNLYYSSSDLQYVDTENQMTNKLNTEERKMTAGFTTSNKTRPLLISKLDSYFRNKEVIIHSSRLIDELNVFIWKSTSSSVKAEAMAGYNDDLVMAIGIGLWVRDTALRLRKESNSISSTIMSKIGSSSNDAIKNNLKPYLPKTSNNPYGVQEDPWSVATQSGRRVDLRWLLE